MVVRKSRAHIATQVDYRVEIAAALHPRVEPAAALCRAKLRRMESPRPRRVTLSGELSGEYLVIEQRSDGSLVLAPDPSRRAGSPSARQAPAGLGSLFSGLLARPAPGPPDVPAILEGWGVELAEEEGVDDFLIADIDGTTGFVAITTQRFIFAANTGRGVGVLAGAPAVRRAQRRARRTPAQAQAARQLARLRERHRSPRPGRPDATGATPERTWRKLTPWGTAPAASTGTVRNLCRCRSGDSISSGSDFERQSAYSRAVVDGDWIHVAGTTGFDYEQMTIAEGVVEQTEQAFRNIIAALEEADATLADVVRVRYILPDPVDFAATWPVLRHYFGDVRPAATMLSCGLVDARMKIEIEVTAHRDSRPSD